MTQLGAVEFGLVLLSFSVFLLYCARRCVRDGEIQRSMKWMPLPPVIRRQNPVSFWLGVGWYYFLAACGVIVALASFLWAVISN